MESSCNSKVKKAPEKIPSYLQFDLGVTAKASPTQKYYCSRPPHGQYTSTEMSYSAKTLLNATSGGREENAKLRDHLKKIITDFAIQNHWDVSKELDSLVKIALTLALTPSINRSNQELGKILKVSRETYRKKWLPKVAEIKSWIKRWWDEIEK